MTATAIGRGFAREAAAGAAGATQDGQVGLAGKDDGPRPSEGKFGLYGASSPN